MEVVFVNIKLFLGPLVLKMYFKFWNEGTILYFSFSYFTQIFLIYFINKKIIYKHNLPTLKSNSGYVTDKRSY